MKFLLFILLLIIIATIVDAHRGHEKSFQKRKWTTQKPSKIKSTRVKQKRAKETTYEDKKEYVIFQQGMDAWDEDWKETSWSVPEANIIVDGDIQVTLDEIAGFALSSETLESNYGILSFEYKLSEKDEKINVLTYNDIDPDNYVFLGFYTYSGDDYDSVEIPVKNREEFIPSIKRFAFQNYGNGKQITLYIRKIVYKDIAYTVEKFEKPISIIDEENGDCKLSSLWENISPKKDILSFEEIENQCIMKLKMSAKDELLLKLKYNQFYGGKFVINIKGKEVSSLSWGAINSKDEDNGTFNKKGNYAIETTYKEFMNDDFEDEDSEYDTLKFITPSEEIEWFIQKIQFYPITTNGKFLKYETTQLTEPIVILDDEGLHWNEKSWECNYNFDTDNKCMVCSFEGHDGSIPGFGFTSDNLLDSGTLVIVMKVTDPPKNINILSYDTNDVYYNVATFTATTDYEEYRIPLLHLEDKPTNAYVIREVTYSTTTYYIKSIIYYPDYISLPEGSAVPKKCDIVSGDDCQSDTYYISKTNLLYYCKERGKPCISESEIGYHIHGDDIYVCKPTEDQNENVVCIKESKPTETCTVNSIGKLVIDEENENKFILCLDVDNDKPFTTDLTDDADNIYLIKSNSKIFSLDDNVYSLITVTTKSIVLNEENNSHYIYTDENLKLILPKKTCTPSDINEFEFNNNNYKLKCSDGDKTGLCKYYEKNSRTEDVYFGNFAFYGRGQTTLPLRWNDIDEIEGTEGSKVFLPPSDDVDNSVDKRQDDDDDDDEKQEDGKTEEDELVDQTKNYPMVMYLPGKKTNTYSYVQFFTSASNYYEFTLSEFYRIKSELKLVPPPVEDLVRDGYTCSNIGLECSGLSYYNFEDNEEEWIEKVDLKLYLITEDGKDEYEIENFTKPSNGWQECTGDIDTDYDNYSKLAFRNYGTMPVYLYIGNTIFLKKDPIYMVKNGVIRDGLGNWSWHKSNNSNNAEQSYFENEVYEEDPEQKIGVKFATKELGNAAYYIHIPNSIMAPPEAVSFRIRPLTDNQFKFKIDNKKEYNFTSDYSEYRNSNLPVGEESEFLIDVRSLAFSDPKFMLNNDICGFWIQTISEIHNIKSELRKSGDEEAADAYEDVFYFYDFILHPTYPSDTSKYVQEKLDEEGGECRITMETHEDWEKCSNPKNPVIAWPDDISLETATSSSNFKEN